MHEECRTASGTRSPAIPQPCGYAVDGELDAAQHLLISDFALRQFLAVLLQQFHLHVVERIEIKGRRFLAGLCRFIRVAYRNISIKNRETTPLLRLVNLISQLEFDRGR